MAPTLYTVYSWTDYEGYISLIVLEKNYKFVHDRRFVNIAVYLSFSPLSLL